MGAGCCDNKAFGEPCADCSFDEAAASDHDYKPSEIGCPFCGGDSVDPFTSAIHWAVRMGRGCDGGDAFGGTAGLLHVVANAPGVVEMGFRPTALDMGLFSLFGGATDLWGGEPAFDARPIVEMVPIADPPARQGARPLPTVGGGSEGELTAELQPGDAGRPTVEVSRPEGRLGALWGTVGYSFAVRYCGLTAGSWLYQVVEILETGHEEIKTRIRGDFTYQRILIGELFLVGEDNCTQADPHSAGARLGAGDELCALCDYQVMRRAAQYTSPTITVGPGGNLDEPAVPTPEMRDAGMVDTGGFRLVTYIRTGVNCLLDGGEYSYSRPGVQVAAGNLTSQWSFYFTWGIPCAPAPVEQREPTDPSPPPPAPAEPSDPTPPAPPPRPTPTTPAYRPAPGDTSGVPTVSSSGSLLTSGGSKIGPGKGGWRPVPDQHGQPGGGMEPVPEDPR